MVETNFIEKYIEITGLGHKSGFITFPSRTVWFIFALAHVVVCLFPYEGRCRCQSQSPASEAPCCLCVRKRWGGPAEGNEKELSYLRK